MLANSPLATSASAAGYTFPAEWATHHTCYTAWPAHEFAWGSALGAAQSEFVTFVRAFTADAGQELLTILVSPPYMEEARNALDDLAARVRLVPFDYGDVWLRDTAPLFLKGPNGLACARFMFNGWGEKYRYPHDDTLATRLSNMRELPSFTYDFVLEGGAIDVDGKGTCLTTRSCLQNPNRGQPESDARIGERLKLALGIEHVIWLNSGLQNDHTDGHVDNIARFVADGVVVCMQAHDADDPNAEALDDIARVLHSERTASGKPLTVVRVPSPGRVLGADGSVMPASYMNFFIGNRAVIMPSFGTRWDAPAQAALQKVFPQHKVVRSSARAILEGGGTFHCMTQQEPSP